MGRRCCWPRWSSIRLRIRSFPRGSPAAEATSCAVWPSATICSRSSLRTRDAVWVAEACAEYLDFFVKEFNNPKVWWYRIHNYNGVNGGAAGCLALTLSDVYPDRADGWLAECVKIIDRWLRTGV